MSDQFKEVTTKGWGSRILDSIKGVLSGFLMFIVSFGVLYWNEGRVDISKIAKTAIEFESTSQSSPAADKKLISTTGILKSNDKIGDTYLMEGNYIALKRNVEMYAWKEEKQEKSTKNTGGSETTETTYTYKKEWTIDPENSGNFRITEGHLNPQMTLNSNSVSVKNAELGIYNVYMSQVSLPQYRDIRLNNSNIILNDNLKLASDQYLFKGSGSISSPEIGDVRVSYSVIHNPLDTATIFGKLDLANKKVSPFYGEKNTKLYRIFEGTRDSAISTMKTEHTILTWIFRGIGFALMWFGLWALSEPISVLLDVLPIFGSIGRVGFGLVTFVISFVLSIITIIVSMIIHNLIALIVVILGTVFGIVWYLKNKRKKQLAVTANSANTMDKMEFEKNRKMLETSGLGFDELAKSAAFFKKAAEDGEDISPVVESLKKLFSRCSQVPIMQNIADALTIYYVNKKELEPLKELLKTTCGDLVLQAAIKKYNKESNFEFTLPFLVDIDPGHIVYSDEIKKYIKADKEKLLKVIKMMNEHKHSRYLIPEFLKNYFTISNEYQLDVSVALPYLAAMLFEDENNKKMQLPHYTGQ
ncbi:MAG: TMEM43 family protein [Nitrospinae bacterium]|nr:TMEM43 family protein [Nitrospinota bacterium]